MRDPYAGIAESTAMDRGPLLQLTASARFTTVFLVSIQFLVLLSVILNIPVLRQIIVLVYLLFMPGFLILVLLGLPTNSIEEVIFLSLGLSIASLMLIGLLVNATLPSFGFAKPLSQWPLLVAVIATTLVLSMVACRGDKWRRLGELLAAGPKIREHVVLLTCLPALAMLGMWSYNRLGMLAVIFLIAVVVLVTVYSERLAPANSYPFVIFVLALTLLLFWQLSSTHLIGWDVFLEFYCFRSTRSYGFWDPTAIFLPGPYQTVLSDYNAMLSVTILPSLFGDLLNVESETVFKFVFPLIYSIVPLILYFAWRQLTRTGVAFLSAFYFMFTRYYYDTSVMKQIVGELFLALIVYLFLEKKMADRKKLALLVTFFAALVVSHYSLAYMLISLLLFVLIFGSVLRSQLRIRRLLVNWGSLLFLLVLTFSWYTVASGAPTLTLYGFVMNVLESVGTDFFLPYQLTGAGGSSMLWVVDQAVSKLLFLFIAIGVIVYLKRGQDQEIRFDYQFAPMVVTAVAVMVMTVLLPAFALGLTIERFVHIALFFLAPFCIVGGVVFFRGIRELASRLRRMRPISKDALLRLVCIVLIVAFLFKIGFIYEVAGVVPISTYYSPLSTDRLKGANDLELRGTFYSYYLPQQDVDSTSWSSTFVPPKSTIYADWSALRTLAGYGNIDPGRVDPILCGSITKPGSYVYFRLVNSEGVLMDYSPTQVIYSVNMSQCKTQLEMMNRVYSNGSGEIDQRPGNVQLEVWRNGGLRCLVAERWLVRCE